MVALKATAPGALKIFQMMMIIMNYEATICYSVEKKLSRYKLLTLSDLFKPGKRRLAADWKLTTNVVFPIPYAIFFQMMWDSRKNHMSEIFSKNALRKKNIKGDLLRDSFFKDVVEQLLI